MKKKVVIAGVVVAVIAVAAGISAMRKKPVEEETLIPVFFQNHGWKLPPQRRSHVLTQ